jgi:hypothetical protein
MRTQGSRSLLAVAVAAAAFALPAAPATAGVTTPCNVPSGTYPTIQSAINVMACDPIVVAAGSYPENLSVLRDVTIQGAGPGQTNLTPTTGTVLSTSAGTLTVSVSGVTVGGTAPQGVAVGTGSILNLTNAVVSGHTASTAAGISVNSTGVPGGIGVLNGTDLTISGNTTTFTGAGGGAGINNLGTVNLTNSTISGNNAAGEGGGFRNGSSTSVATLTNVTIFGNNSNGDGAGFMNASGGAIGSLRNTTVSGNTADNDNNMSGDGGGVFNGGGTLNLRNAIVANNSDKGLQAPDCGGVPPLVTRQGYVLIRNQAPCTFSGGDDATGYQTNVDPLLAGALASNGGPTQTLALLSGSPALNKIPSALCLTATDQRGSARPSPSGGLCDLGAYEMLVPPPVCLAAAHSATCGGPVPRKPKCKKKAKHSAGAAKKKKKKCKKKKKK